MITTEDPDKTIRLRELSRLEYFDPRATLCRMAPIQAAVAGSSLSEAAKSLRPTRYRPAREGWEACVFGYAMSQVIRRTVEVAPVEAYDFDFVCRVWDQGEVHYAPVQLKELVPAELNSKQSLESLIESIQHKDFRDTVVAVRLNRALRLTAAELPRFELNAAALWLFGFVAPDQSSIAVCGDLLTSEPQTYVVPHPALG